MLNSSASKAPKTRILMICTGNICRSPMAQFLAECLAGEAHLPWIVSSAGVAGEIGMGMEPGAVKALESRGLTGLTHRARQVNEEMLAHADIVYAMTRDHKRTLAREFPSHAAKVQVLAEAAGLEPADIFDPYAESDAVYEECAARIEQALKILIEKRTLHAQNAR